VQDLKFAQGIILANHNDLKVTTKNEKYRTAASGGFHAGEGAGATLSYKANNLAFSIS
jgi:hypothetical protein